MALVNYWRWARLSAEQRTRLLRRAQGDIDSIMSEVAEIVASVKNGGDHALCRYIAKFDHIELRGGELRVAEDEIENAETLLPQSIRKAIDFSVENAFRFHRPQKRESDAQMEIRPGVFARERVDPISSVGLYVPRGRGSFPSMLYMMAVPARIAGARRVVVTTPALPDGSVDPACLYAAKLCGVAEIYRAGGAHAIAALAYGTESIEGVDAIFGPGSAWVAAAKRVVASVVNVGLPAGPSEAIILADRSANARNAALDLAIEAEHGVDSSALLITDCESIALAVQGYVDEAIEATPSPRGEILARVFGEGGYGGIILCEDQRQAVDLVNRFAPEHLQIRTENPEKTAEEIVNSGEILLGDYAPFSLANYAVGANAVLPTGGAARSWSGLSVRDFQKSSAIISINRTGYRSLRDHVIALADYEGFFRHAEALRQRDEDHGV